MVQCVIHNHLLFNYWYITASYINYRVLKTYQLFSQLQYLYTTHCSNYINIRDLKTKEHSLPKHQKVVETDHINSLLNMS